MRKAILIAAAGLAVLSGLPASAAVQTGPDRDRTEETRPQRPAQAQPSRNPAQPNQARSQAQNQRPNQTSHARYGTWQAGWGARPSATPPRHFTRQNDWYRHVRVCQQRYRTYNPATDTFIARPGVRQICRL